MSAVPLVPHQDRRALATKVALRLAVLPTDRPARVLDCFAGDHDIWDTAREVATQPIEVLHNDIDPSYGTHLAVAAVDAVRSLDLDCFDLIDLDAWGPPYTELAVLAQRRYGGVATYTSIIDNGTHHHEVPIEAVGVPLEWRNPAPMRLDDCEAPTAQRWVAFLDSCGWERTHIVQTRSRRPGVVHLYGACGSYEYFNTDRYNNLFQDALRSRRLAQVFRGQRGSSPR